MASFHSIHSSLENNLKKELNEAKHESCSDVCYEIANHFIITVGRAFSTTAAYLGMIAFLAPVEWYVVKIFIAASVGWWAWKQSENYFFEKTPFLDPNIEAAAIRNEEKAQKHKEQLRKLHQDITQHNSIEPLRKHHSAHEKESLDKAYFIGPKKYLNEFFRALSIIVFVGVCLTAFFPTLLPIFGPAGVLATTLGLGGAISTIPYLAAGLATLTYITQSIIYALGRLTFFCVEKVSSLFEKQPYDERKNGVNTKEIIGKQMQSNLGQHTAPTNQAKDLSVNTSGVGNAMQDIGTAPNPGSFNQTATVLDPQQYTPPQTSPRSPKTYK